MHKLFYPQLASSNIKKNGATYIPYILTCIFTIALFYMMESLSLNKGIDNMTGSDTIRYSMKLGCWIAAFFPLYSFFIPIVF